MALINCEECKKEISSEADACPNCGFKIKKREVKFDTNSDKSDSQLIWDTVATGGKIAMVVCLVIGGCIYLGGDDKRSAWEKAAADRDKKCFVAKQTGDIGKINSYCP